MHADELRGPGDSRTGAIGGMLAPVSGVGSGETLRGSTDPLGDTAPGTGASVGLMGNEDAPERIGRHRVLGKLGEGGMGLVYAAHDDELERRVAIKLLRPETGGEPRRLLREARSMARLCHPNVAAIYDVGTHGDAIYLAMEYVHGSSLREWSRVPHPWPERAAVLIQAAEGLAAAHEAELVHRDFKPENVIVGTDGRVRVLDFGLAKLAPDSRGPRDDSATQTGALVGTPRYMAPEQLRSHAVGPATDQFAFCLTAYEIAYGARPFEGEVFAEHAASVLRGDPRPPPEHADAPVELWPILQRGLSRDPDDRYPSMSSVIEALRRLSMMPAVPAPIVSRPALHEARERAREQLASAFAHDLLDADELDERLDQLESAANEDVVERLVADLATRPEPAALVPVRATESTRPVRILSIFSAAERRGQWAPAPHTRVIAAFGSVEIDLRDAMLPPEGLEIAVQAGLASVEIFVPPGVPVDVDCLAIVGSVEQDEPSAPPKPGAPRIRVTGFVAFGSVEVRERLIGESGREARKRRKAAKKALREAAQKALPSAKN